VHDEGKMVWDAMQVSAMRRQALLDCLDTIRGMVKLSWARSSALQTMDLVAKTTSKWCKCQEEQSLNIIKAAKAARPFIIKVVYFAPP
jgi:hypothetical protein